MNNFHYFHFSKIYVSLPHLCLCYYPLELVINHVQSLIFSTLSLNASFDLFTFTVSRHWLSRSFSGCDLAPLCGFLVIHGWWYLSLKKTQIEDLSPRNSGCVNLPSAFPVFTVYLYSVFHSIALAAGHILLGNSLAKIYTGGKFSANKSSDSNDLLLLLKIC